MTLTHRKTAATCTLKPGEREPEYASQFRPDGTRGPRACEDVPNETPALLLILARTEGQQPSEKELAALQAQVLKLRVSLHLNPKRKRGNTLEPLGCVSLADASSLDFAAFAHNGSGQFGKCATSKNARRSRKNTYLGCFGTESEKRAKH